MCACLVRRKKSCEFLRTLNASHNQIEKYPKVLGTCFPFLERLHLDHNGLSKLPEISGLTSLRTLSIDGSPIKAGLPPSLSVLRRLEELDMSFCFTKAMAKRKGNKLPCLDALGALANNPPPKPKKAADTADAANAASTSSTSSSNGGSTSKKGGASKKGVNDGAEDEDAPPAVALTMLALRGNNLGELPGYIGKLSRVTTLNLSQNNLPELPDAIGEMVQLEVLRVDRNALMKLPNAIGKLVVRWKKWMNMFEVRGREEDGYFNRSMDVTLRPHSSCCSFAPRLRACVRACVRA
jgi:Leucine-rich repeat (LRR) protein